MCALPSNARYALDVLYVRNAVFNQLLGSANIMVFLLSVPFLSLIFSPLFFLSFRIDLFVFLSFTRMRIDSNGWFG